MTMATNSQNTFPLVASAVPADRQCVQNLSDILQGAVDFLMVQGLGGNAGSSFPSQDTLGQQALQLAQQVQAQIAGIIASLPTFRTSTTNSPIPDGTNEIGITWTTPLPGTNYSVFFGFQALTGGAISASFFAYVVAGSQTTTGCTVHFEGAPATSKGLTYSFVVIYPPNASNLSTVISGFTPTTGTTGTVVTIFGVGFTGVGSVVFNGVAASAFTVNSDNQITATVAAGTPTGAGGIAVTNAVGSTVTSATSFNFT